MVHGSALTLRRAHWMVGIATLALFLFTGAYMRWLRHPPVPELDPFTRSLYRSRHLFLLLAAAANLALSYASEHAAGGRRKAQRIASILIIAAPVLFLVGFWRDPSRGIEQTTWAALALYMMFAAAVLLIAAGRPRY